MKTMLLIYPPLTKACEPPLGIARLAACLRSHGVGCETWDANLEGQLALLENPLASKASLTLGRQSWGRLANHLAYLSNPLGYDNFDRYQTAVYGIAKLLQMSVAPLRCTITLADFNHSELQPVRSTDLHRIADEPEHLPFHRFFLQQLQARFERHRPDYIGLSVNYLSQALCAFALIGLIRKLDDRIPVILGGGLITSWMARPGWRNPFSGLVDELVAGPGEAALLKWLQLSGDIKEFSRPDYHTLALSHYFSPGFILPFSTAFGCYWNKCKFCPEKSEGHRFQPVTNERISQDLEALGKELKPRLIHFTDNALSPRLLRHLILHPPPAPWYGFTRITPLLAERDFCLALKKSGCVMLKLGIESGDDKVLEGMNKGHTVELAGKVLQQLYQAGIAVYVYLLFGTPWEDEAAARATLEFVLRHQGEITFINPAIFNQPIEADLEVQPFYHGDLSLYTSYQHPSDWSRSQVRRFLDRTFKRDRAVAAILRRTPPFFTSNHAPFFVEHWSEA